MARLRSRGKPRSFTPAPWFDLALKTGEMLLASAQVIGYRTERLARAGAKPSARDRREFALMVQEKYAAAAQSAIAMAPSLWKLQALGANLMARQMQTALHTMLGSRGGSALPAAAAAIGRAAADSGKLGPGLIRCARKGLKPVHARAVANRKRLSKAKRT